jgi:hypothetical protein
MQAFATFELAPASSFSSSPKSRPANTAMLGGVPIAENYRGEADRIAPQT